MKNESNTQIEQGYDYYLEDETNFIIDLKNDGDSGRVTIKFPQNEVRNRLIESDDELLIVETTERFMIHEDGSIVLGRWLPDRVYDRIIRKILEGLFFMGIPAPIHGRALARYYLEQD